MSAADERTIAQGQVASALAGVGAIRRAHDLYARMCTDPDAYLEDADEKQLEKIHTLELETADAILDAAIGVARAIRADAREHDLRRFVR
jgi:hypothetical protein